VIGIDYGPQIDVWGLGCVLCEMVMGRPLFEAEDETELMQMYLKVLGMPPEWMVMEGKRAEYYFRPDGAPILRSNSEGKCHAPGTSNIQMETQIEDKLLLALVCGCLTWDPAARLTPQAILEHAWLHTK
jgi:serine/threonine protein kinase